MISLSKKNFDVVYTKEGAKMIFLNLFSKLLPYEEAILKSIKMQLSDKARSIFEKQLDAFNKVQRLDKNKEVDFYCKKRGKIWFDDQLRFPLALPEVKLAEVEICFSNKITGQFKEIIATIWLVNGRLFSINFNIPPKPYLKDEFKILKIKILVDPLQEIKTILIESSYINELINKYLPNSKIQEIFAPIDHNWTNKVINQLNCKLPTDWVELLKHCDGITLNQCKIYGIHNIRYIDVDGYELVIIVEGLGSNVLAVDRYKNDGHVYHMDLSKDTGERIDYGDSVLLALQKYMRRESLHM